MSTNYYAKTTADDGDGLHIGQHVGGAEFLFRAHPDLGLSDCEAWRRFLEKPGVHIVAEHGLVEPLEEFWPAVTARPADVGGLHWMRARWQGHREGDQWRDIHGHPFDAREFC